MRIERRARSASLRESDNSGTSISSASRRLIQHPFFWTAGILGGAIGVFGAAAWHWPTGIAVALSLLLAGIWFGLGCSVNQRADTILLVGKSSELSLLAAMLGCDSTENATYRGRSLKVLRFDSIDDLRSPAGTVKCDEAVFPQLPGERVADIIDARGRVIKLVPAHQVLERLLGRSDLHVHEGSSPRSHTALGRFDVIKRVADVIGASIMLAALAIPMLIVAAMFVALQTVPPIVRRECAGRHGRTFRMLRFPSFDSQPAQRGISQPTTRTMRFSLRLRRILQRSHFDTTPALWNILTGDMSFIGPRPESPAEHERNLSRVPMYHVRLMCRPGLASLAQVRFRYSEALRDARLALEYDAYYVRHQSAPLDIRILLRASWLLVSDWVGTVGLLGHYIRKSWQASITGLRRRRSHRASAIASVPMPADGNDGTAPLKPTLLVGAGAGGRLLARDLRHHRSWGLWPVAFVDDDLSKIGTRISDIPVLGDTAAIAAIAKREHVDTVILAIPSASDIEIKRIADIVHELDVELLTMPNIGTILRGKSAVELTTVPVTDFLGRSTVAPDLELCDAFLRDKRVLVTGAAGSIGQEVARQVASSTAAIVYGLDINESDLFDLQQELLQKAGTTPFVPIVASVTQPRRLESLFAAIRPDIVFHAAAYKHVPMMEEHPTEAVAVNVAGTLRVARAAAAAGTQRFVLVSTDKAVRPSSVMGATKRLAEFIIRDVARQTGMSACAVRFGNVLGSRGSVIPLFRKQIAAGGPVTVTHRDMMRYFMTIPEAAGLIIQAGAFGDNGVVYMLDMGEEVSIQQLAERMIRLQGLRVDKDIGIRYTGLRPGEKMRESLSLDFETASETPHPKIRILHDDIDGISVRSIDSDQLVDHLTDIAETATPPEIRDAIMRQIKAIDGAIYGDTPSKLSDSDLVEVEGDLAGVSSHVERHLERVMHVDRSRRHRTGDRGVQRLDIEVLRPRCLRPWTGPRSRGGETRTLSRQRRHVASSDSRYEAPSS